MHKRIAVTPTPRLIVSIAIDEGKQGGLGTGEFAGF